MSSEVALFNIERTIMDNPIGPALEFLRDRGEIINSHPDDLQLKKQRGLMLGWLTNRAITEVKPVLEQVVSSTPQQLAPWANLIMLTQAGAGRELGVYSSTLPQFFVDAVATGIETILPEGKGVTYHFGKPMSMSNGRLSGRVGPMLKAETVESMQSAGAPMHVIADSFKMASVATKKATHKLIVNPSFDYRVSAAPDQIIINFDFDKPEMVDVVNGAGDQYLCDLGNVEGRRAFIDVMNDIL